MSTAQIWQTTATDVNDTWRLAEQLGERLRGGELIELVSDLGGGKTTFVKGLAKGLGSSDTVSSPTFTISNEYRAGALKLYHFDFYRLGEAGILSEELAEVLDDKQAVTVIEWAGIVESQLPAERLTITIRATGDTSREFNLSYLDSLSYLIPRVT